MPETNYIYYWYETMYRTEEYTNPLSYYTDKALDYFCYYVGGDPEDYPHSTPPTGSHPPTGSNPPSGSNPPYVPNTGTIPYYPPH